MPLPGVMCFSDGLTEVRDRFCTRVLALTHQPLPRSELGGPVMGARVVDHEGAMSCHLRERPEQRVAGLFDQADVGRPDPLVGIPEVSPTWPSAPAGRQHE